MGKMNEEDNYSVFWHRNFTRNHQKGGGLAINAWRGTQGFDFSFFKSFGYFLGIWSVICENVLCPKNVKFIRVFIKISLMKSLVMRSELSRCFTTRRVLQIVRTWAVDTYSIFRSESTISARHSRVFWSFPVRGLRHTLFVIRFLIRESRHL